MNSESSPKAVKRTYSILASTVFTVASCSATLTSWLYSPGPWLGYLAHQMFSAKSPLVNAACGSLMPIVAVVLGSIALWCGRREGWSFWRALAFGSVVISLAVVAIDVSYLWYPGGPWAVFFRYSFHFP